MYTIYVCIYINNNYICIYVGKDLLSVSFVCRKQGKGGSRKIEQIGLGNQYTASVMYPAVIYLAVIYPAVVYHTVIYPALTYAAVVYLKYTLL